GHRARTAGSGERKDEEPGETSHARVSSSAGTMPSTGVPTHHRLGQHPHSGGFSQPHARFEFHTEHGGGCHEGGTRSRTQQNGLPLVRGTDGHEQTDTAALPPPA